MAFSPKDMMKAKEIVDPKIVAKLEMEVDQFLAKQPKNQREYSITWKNKRYVSEINLEALAKIYIKIG
jgi:hypothetical protein